MGVLTVKGLLAAAHGNDRALRDRKDHTHTPDFPQLKKKHRKGKVKTYEYCIRPMQLVANHAMVPGADSREPIADTQVADSSAPQNNWSDGASRCKCQVYHAKDFISFFKNALTLYLKLWNRALLAGHNDCQVACRCWSLVESAVKRNRTISSQVLCRQPSLWRKSWYYSLWITWLLGVLRWVMTWGTYRHAIVLMAKNCAAIAPPCIGTRRFVWRA